MKITIAYFLLFLYTIAMCKPVLPLVQDKLAHIFWKAAHIATVHHHHGGHHAKEEIAKAAHEEESNKLPAPSKTPETVSIHIVLQSFYSLASFSIEKKVFGAKNHIISSHTLDTMYPPPKAC